MQMNQMNRKLDELSDVERVRLQELISAVKATTAEAVDDVHQITGKTLAKAFASREEACKRLARLQVMLQCEARELDELERAIAYGAAYEVIGELYDEGR